MPTPTPRKLILVVDDSADIRKVVSQFLQLENYAVAQAENGQEALARLEQMIPDLILSDINMPRLDGIGFFQTVRKNLRWSSIPFIFLTSRDSPRDIQAGRELGVEDYLIKPIRGDDLVRIVGARLLRAAELQIAHMDQAYLETVNVLANTIEGRDPYTAGHVERVAKYARELALATGWPTDHLRLLDFGARLHDIGKIIVPDQVLKKPGKLSAEEWTLMKQHPEAGARIIGDISHLRPITPYILYHHERWDGKGYPAGMQGLDIPLEGRLLAVVDVFDAMTSERPYQPAHSAKDALAYIRSACATHFDAELASVFVESYEKLNRSAR